ncbi:MAG: amidohydrolase family protein [Bryobacterales bacterium]
MPITRRTFLATATMAAAHAAARPPGFLIDTHIHLFAKDQTRFPYHPDAPYQPPAADLADYKTFLAESKIDHVVIVHPEPYQDDHRYLEYCFANEPTPGLFKGTCLFDPIAPETPGRMEEIVARNPGRIVAMRIHEMRGRGAPPAKTGAIKDRDLADPRMKDTWRKARQLNIAIQMHFTPWFAPGIGRLANEFDDVPVILDHIGRAGMGTPADYAEVLKLAKLPRTYLKFSGWRYSSKQGQPFRDAKPIVQKAYDAFGPDRIVWGGLGHNSEEFSAAIEVFELMFDYASDQEKANIRGLIASKLFHI